MSTPLKLKLKVSVPLTNHDATDDNSENKPSASSHSTTMQQPLLVGARGGAALKDLLSTAPNPEVAIRDFQAAHALSWTPPLPARMRPADAQKQQKTTFTPAVQLLDLLTVQRSSVYNSLLEKLIQEMLLRIDELPKEELQRVLEVTFPYIEFRELRSIPIAILSRQEDTPEVYLRELTENRKILTELPVHVRRKIMHVDTQELHIFVEQCTHEYIEDITEWYLKHPGQTIRGQVDHPHPATNVDASTDLWNVTSHMPSTSSSSSSANSARQSRWGPSPEERRRNSPALAKLTEMLGDSESLYLATVDILKEYVVAANIPGSTNSNPKEYVDYVPFLGALRADLANIQRDRTTVLLRTDPLHKFIWFLDRAMKNQTLETSQLHELLGFIAKLRTGDLPPNKKFKKKTSGVGAEIQEEEENFEVVLGPPPAQELLTLLDKIAKTDPRLIFAEPVPDDVPKYREIIKEPMDLSTMRKKVKRGKYKTIEMFTDDFNLMIRNCMTFNPDTTVFYKEGKRIGKRGNELIDKNMTALRGEPQRIRAKKRRKVGPSEAVSMLTSTGVAALKDFGDVDQSGMVPEGMCDDMLADVAMILSDPHVKQLLCDALMKTLVLCWQKKELPTDNLICRGIVQLLQIGNPSSVRRMIRKKDFVLRAPQVVTMRVVLPLLLRSMAANRVYFAFPPSFQRDLKAKEELLDGSLWENVLRASSAIRTMTKAFSVQCLVDHQIELGAQLLRYILAAEDDLLLRDRPFLHAVGEVVLDQIKAAVTGSGDTSDASTSPSDRLKSLNVWRLVVKGFFLRVLEQRIASAKETTGRVIVLFEAGESAEDDDVRFGGSASPRKPQSVKSFPVPVFHEKAVMLLASVLDMVEKAEPAIAEDTIAPFVTQTLGVLRRCCASLEEFEQLWASQVFHGCREYYEQLLARCPQLRAELFSSTAPASSPKGVEQLQHKDGEARTQEGKEEEETAGKDGEREQVPDQVDNETADAIQAEPKVNEDGGEEGEEEEGEEEEGEEEEGEEADS